MADRKDGEKQDRELSTGGALDLLSATTGGADAFIGRQIGSYRIASLLGEGGMGRVYLGERVDGQFDRRAAVKILPSGVGEEYVRRFHQERTILAGLNHPNIAQLYDAGVTEAGNLYLIMELVEGEPIDEYCEARGLGLRERLKLVVQLCGALRFAHGKLVLHRDIKPSNVLVTHEGQLKLLDFGIAKMVEQADEHTRGVAPMTPRFASPEQLVGGTATIASDIFQTGVLLYLLLYGRSPFEDMELRDRIAQVTDNRAIEIPPEGTRPVPKDVRTIIGHCLALDGESRYPDANALMTDIRNYLGGYPLNVQPPGWPTVAGKWLKRNALLSATTGALLAVLVGTSAWYTWSLARSEAAAEREAAVATQTTELILDLLKAGDPLVAQGEEPTVRAVLDAGLERIRDSQIDNPEVSVQIAHTLAHAYENLGASEKAAELMRVAYEDGRERLGPDHPLTWNALNLLANAENSLGNYEVAESLYATLRDSIERNDYQGRARAVAYNGTALLYLRTGRYEEAIEFSERAVQHATEQLGARNEATLIFQNTLSDIYNNAGQPDKAIELLTRVTPIADEVLGRLHQSATGMVLNRAVSYYQKGELDQAAPLLAEVRERNLEVFGPDHPDTIRDTVNLGILYGDTGRLEEGEPLIREGIRRQSELFGPTHPMTVRYKSNLASVLVVNERWDDVLELCSEVIPQHREIHGETHWYTIEARRSCAMARYETGDVEVGAAELRSVLADMHENFGEEFAYAVETAEYMQERGIL